ncbi:sugar porter family MFS transporter [Nonomuraea sp. NPDC050556]|uniref:sugar porter family MFS transporter n=1 Tax=Nonomuraea sp. NPDC050556 TaxID=3364369 RepID=UPI0037BBDF00
MAVTESGEASDRPVARTDSGPGKSSLIKWALFATLGSFLFGYDTGVVSGAMLYIRDQFHLSSFMQGAVVSVLLLSAAATAPFAGRFADRHGRRFTLIVVAVIFTVGLLVAALAPNVWFLLLARLILGAGVGAASAIVPVYLSEMAPTKMRGRVVSMHQLMVTIGLLTSYLVDLAFSGSENWRAMFGAGLVVSVLMIVGMRRSPETPAWLLQNERPDQARAVLKEIYPAGQVDQVMAAYGAGGKGAGRRMSWREVLTSPAVRPALIVGVGLAALQQFSGINTIMYYAPTIMEKTGLNASNALVYSIVIGVINLVMTLVALRLTDSAGRRPLLIVSAALMMLATIPLGLAFITLTGSASSLTALASTGAYIMAFAVGLGPVFWLLNSEIYPPQARAQAASIATMVNWLSNFIVSQSFLPLSESIGQGATFWLFGAVCALTLLFIIRRVPETKNRTLAQISDSLHHTGHNPA